MEKQNVFKWKHYQPDIILLPVRWYLRYNLSFRDLVEMMEERGLFIAHTTIMRWVHQYGPELDKRIRRHLKQTNDSWRVDETYIKFLSFMQVFYTWSIYQRFRLLQKTRGCIKKGVFMHFFFKHAHQVLCMIKVS